METLRTEELESPAGEEVEENKDGDISVVSDRESNHH